MTDRMALAWLNSVAGSAVFPPKVRSVLMRMAGVDALRAGVCPYVRFASGRQVTLGEGAFLNMGVTLDAGGPIEIGPRVSVGPNAMFITSSHPIGPPWHRGGAGVITYEPIRVEEGCWIGAGAMVLGGVTIGRGCVIAAGSVVKDDCEPDGLYAGSPARRKRDLADAPTIDAI